MFPKETNVLIVDDMMTMRKLVKKALTEAGFTRITEAPDGKEALDKVKLSISSKNAFQLIISDWNMPVLSGIELLKAVRENPQTSSLPFVLLTAESEKSQILEAQKLRVSGYIIKPFTPHQLIEKLHTIGAAIQVKKAA